MNEINKNIDSKDQVTQAPESQEKQPDERGGIYVQSHIKIFDPETDEVYVNGRA